ncbi:stage V sporulation protein B [Paenibacillus chartarius]|uniref:Stage V sporulation protein B n=1 Tax=Paenibacillus chartarius TaxID=747481 RepID=A0ABV6DIU1_9BACL
MSKQSFIKGTLILLAAGLVNRLLGFVPRITLPRVIGAEGVGLYQIVWPFLIVVLTFITGGIPVAVAKLVAEAEAERNERRIRSILKLALAITCSLSVLFTALCLIGAEWITTRLMTDDRVYYTFLCMIPIIGLIGVSSVFRGYFQGRQNMIPTATSQTAETIVRIIMMLSGAYVLLPYGVEVAAAGAMLGVLAGELAGLLLLLYHYRESVKASAPKVQATIGTSTSVRRLSGLRRMLKISVPITGSKLVGATSYLLESIFITQALAVAGISTAMATAQYGALQGMVIPILLLPSALTSSLSVSLIPSLSEAAARKDMDTIHKLLRQSLRLALVSGAPFGVLMYVLADPICVYLYNQPNVGVLLKMMAPVAVFIYFQAPLQAALQALDRPGSALVNTLIGSVIKLGLIALLASKPELGIKGAVFAINVNIVLVTLLHWSSVVRALKFSMNLPDFVKIGAAMAVSGLSSYAVMAVGWTDSGWIRFLSSAALGMTVYVMMVVWMGLIDTSDVQRMKRWGRKIWRRT